MAWLGLFGQALACPAGFGLCLRQRMTPGGPIIATARSCVEALGARERIENLKKRDNARKTPSAGSAVALPILLPKADMIRASLFNWNRLAKSGERHFRFGVAALFDVEMSRSPHISCQQRQSASRHQQRMSVPNAGSSAARASSRAV